MATPVAVGMVTHVSGTRSAMTTPLNIALFAHAV
jgi:hypothetical protein